MGKTGTSLGPSAEAEFFKQLEQGLKQRGTLDGLRLKTGSESEILPC